MKKTDFRLSAAALIVLCALLFSALFLLEQAEHDCAGDGCRICAALAVCERIVRMSVVLGCSAVFLRTAHLPRTGLPGKAEMTVPVRTPVALKIKLSD